MVNPDFQSSLVSTQMISVMGRDLHCDSSKTTPAYID